MTSSLLGVFLSVGSDCEEGKARRRENSRYKNTLWGAQVWKEGTMCGVEGRYNSRRAGGLADTQEEVTR